MLRGTTRWLSAVPNTEARELLAGLFRRCRLEPLPGKDGFWSEGGSVAPFMPLLVDGFHFENHHYTTLGDVVIQQYVADSIDEFFVSRNLIATMQCATELAACVHNHYSLRLCAERLGFNGLCVPSRRRSKNDTNKSLDFLEPRPPARTNADTAGTSFAFAPLACGQDSLGWKFSHFIGAVHVKFGKNAARDIVHEQLQLYKAPNFPLQVATKVKDVVENYPITSVAVAILAAQGLNAEFNGKSMIVGGPTRGSSVGEGEASEASNSPGADDETIATADAGEDPPISTEAKTSNEDEGVSGNEIIAGDDGTPVPPVTGGEPMETLRSAALSMAAGPPLTDMLSHWKKKNNSGGIAGAAGKGQVTAGWLSEDERRRAQGPAYANRVAFKTYFADMYSLAQPTQGKWIFKYKRPPVRDPQFYDKASSMRNGIPFDTRGLSVDEYVAKMCQPSERRFEVTMSVMGQSQESRVVAKVITRSYTEGRVAACRMFLHRVVKDVEAVAANAAPGA